MTWLLFPDSVSRDALIQIAREQDWKLVNDEPRHRNRNLVWSWAAGEARVHYIEKHSLSARCLFLEGQHPSVAALDTLPLLSMTAVIERAAQAQDTSERIRLLLGGAALAHKELPTALRRALDSALDENNQALSRAILFAASFSAGGGWNEFLEATATRFESDDERHQSAAALLEAIQKSEAGEHTADLETASQGVLWQKLGEAQQKEQPIRVEAAATKILSLQYNEFNTDALQARAFARETLGKSWPGLVDALFCIGLCAHDDKEPAKELHELKDRLHQALHTEQERPDPDILKILDEAHYLGKDKAVRGVLDGICDLDHGLVAEVSYRRALVCFDKGPRQDALEAITTVLEIEPDCLQAKKLYAHLVPDGEDALEAIDAALAAADSEPNDFERLARELTALVPMAKYEPHDLLRRKLLILQKMGREQECIKVAEQGIEIAPDSSMAWLDHAMMLTSQKKHAEAVSAYDRAIELIESEDIAIFIGGCPSVAWFNRACERTKVGDHEGALTDLAEAIRRESSYHKDVIDETQGEKWQEQARTEEYFDPLREDPRFQRILDGDLDAAPPPPPPKGKGWAELAQECKALASQGQWDDAIDAGEDALDAAEEESDQARATCLTNLGWAELFGGDPAAAREHLAEAVELHQASPPQDPLDAADTLHHLGSAHLAAGAFDDARRCYERAMAAREDVLGKDHPVIAKSFGDMARLAAEAGDDEKAIDQTERAAAILTKVVQHRPEGLTQDQIDEACLDLGITAGNATVLHRRNERYEEAFESALLATEAYVAYPWDFNASLAESLAAELDLIAQNEPSLAKPAEQLIFRLEDRVYGPPPSPQVQSEKNAWAIISQGLLSLRDQGMSEKEIAEAMRGALKGAPPSKEVAQNREATEALVLFGKHVSNPGVMVTGAMSVDLLACGQQSLEKTLDDLRVFGEGHAEDR